MRAKKCVSILVAASLATTMLTACPWEKEEDKTDDASSVPVTSTDTSQDDDDHDSGNKDEEEKDPTPPEVTNNNSGQNGTVAIETPIYDKTSKTFSVTFTTEPTNDTHIASRVSVTGSTKDGGTFSGNWSAAGNTAAFARAEVTVTITSDDDHKEFTVTGIPADATSCTISVTFENLGYVIEDSVYKVHDAKGLLAWNEAAQKDPSLSCTLTADINLTEQSWTPIGSLSNPYTGTFDGGGHAISGLHVSSTGNYIGLFSYVDSGTVKNLNLEITSVSGNDFVGGVVGYNYAGTIHRCMVSGNVSGSRYVGGVVGYNNETVEGCCFAGSGSSVTGSASSAWVGGVVGANNDTVEGCCFAGGSVSDTGDGAYVGGVVGFNYDYGTITACYWQEGTGDSPSKGVGNDSGEENCKKVDGTNVTLTTAISTMNDCIRGTGYKYEQQGENIVLVADGSSTPEVSGLTQKVLDTARMFGL